MPATLTFLDETLTGDILQQWDIPVEAQTLTLREIIMLRVEAEIRRLEKESIEPYFTAPAGKSGWKNLLKQQNAPDAEAHGYRALEAFRKNAYFVLIDNRQADDLEETFALRPTTSVSFVRLTPLVGG